MRTDKKGPRLTDKQVNDLTYLLLPQVDDYIKANWDRCVAYLEEIKDSNPQAAKELAEIKNRSDAL